MCLGIGYDFAPTVWKSLVIYRRSSGFCVFVHGTSGKRTTAGGVCYIPISVLPHLQDYYLYK